MTRTLLATVADASDGWVGSWSPGIGDPTFVGWFTVAAYLITAGLCWRAFRRVDQKGPRHEAGAGAVMLATLIVAIAGAKRRVLAIPVRDRIRALWLVLSVFLLLLGINKQLDLQTALTEWGRMMAHSEGWYESRRIVQLAFIAAVILVGLVALRAVLLLAHGGVGLRSVVGGVVFLACFVVIRASSFHHVDRLLGYDIGNIRLNWVFELGGIAFIAVGAYRQTARRSPAAT